MGILNGPRINFWGGIQTNVCTANNADDVGTKALLDLATSMVNPKYSDDAVIAQMRTPATNSDGDPSYTNGGWNYYGDHQVNFVSASVSSQGEAGAVAESGDLVGQPIYLLGSIDPVTGQGPFFGPVMVDLDPTSGQTTQIFVGGLQIGPSDQPTLLIRHDAVCSSHCLGKRILNLESDAPDSSVGNGTFQVTFPKTAVKTYDPNSPVIAAIMDDKLAAGFVLRFSMFEMAPYLTTSELVAAYDANTNPSNPSSGRVVGTLGPHYASEPQTCPPGRLLQNSAIGAEGFVLLDETEKRLSIDTLNLFPKENFRDDRKDFTGPIGANIDYGTITISTEDASSPLALTFDALPATYYKFGGIVDIALSDDQVDTIKTSALTLSGSKGENTVSITEQALRIYSNARNLYVDDLVGVENQHVFLASYLGGPLAEDTTFTVTSSTPGTLDDPYFMSVPDPFTVKKGEKAFKLDLCPKSDDDAYGFECLTIESGESSYFVNFRKYLKTDFGLSTGATITWAQAYEFALRFHYVVFPAMSMRIPLNDQGTVVATGPQILARLSPKFRDTTLCMPITRSLSPSQIQLLDCYLSNEPWTPLSQSTSQMGSKVHDDVSS